MARTIALWIRYFVITKDIYTTFIHNITQSFKGNQERIAKFLGVQFIGRLEQIKR